tara:strand:- start:99 stop:413 length:315 start_codon:yes stop_codon:yes gene_type:complete
MINNNGLKPFNPATYKYTPQLLPRQSKQTGKRFEVGVMYNREKSIDSGQAVYDAAIKATTPTLSALGEGNSPQDAADAAIANYDARVKVVTTLQNLPAKEGGAA